MEEVALVIHEAGEAPVPVAPPQPGPVLEARTRLHAELLHAVQRGKIGVVEVVDGAAGNLRFLFQVIGADDAGIERAEALPLPIVAHLEVDALVPLPSDS